MNMVGRVGSLISQGVYSVATPFHPFGGAVDIIVVEQEDGSYRSMPWYVRFGKFQGVIKGQEKVVSILVNGVEADFHMYLDHSGQAYFLREVASSDAKCIEPCSMESSPHKPLTEAYTLVDDAEVHEFISEEHREGKESDIGYLDDQPSPERSSTVSGAFSPFSYGNLEEVEEMVKSTHETNSEMVLISVDGHVLTAPISENEEESTDYVQSTNPQFHLGPGDGPENFGGIFSGLDTSGQQDERADSVYNAESRDSTPRDTGICEGTSSGTSICDEEDGHRDVYGDHDNTRKRNKDMFKSCLDFASHLQDVEQNMAFEPEGNRRSPKISSPCENITEDSAVSDNSNCRTDALHHVHEQVKVTGASASVVEQNQEDRTVTSGGDICNSDLPCDNLSATGYVIDASGKVSINEGTANSCSLVSSDLETIGSISARSAPDGECSHPGVQHNTSELGFELSLCGNLLRRGMGLSSAEAVFETHRVSEEEFRASGQSIIRNRNLIIRFNNSYLPWDKASYIVLGKAAFGSNFSCEIQDSIPIQPAGPPESKDDAYARSPSSRWRLWPIPFRRAASLQHSDSNSSSEEFFLDSECGLQSPCAQQSPILTKNLSRLSPRKQLLRTYIPTSEQIASLNLKDGQNIIAFSFSTRVLGKQEVDAHIYLWKWNARIVISDVDGTITKSDVLGQVMPLVGKDWSQSGVAGLFSAIKENGYQLLFLSARAIVQAYLTRSFLFNLKQDGKALPSGPVVISPDGLFPSLFREVIRRAPHEFKIACLEDIKALFPSDYNPFYAGFGNRDTDELSYRKVGIPKGKIFIINPKGEVAINNCIDVKSYTSLHTLVNDMFPPTSLVEQEDFNSWNYWKMPVPTVD